MLRGETIGRIRREPFLKGKTIREIAQDLKVFRKILMRTPKARHIRRKRAV